MKELAKDPAAAAEKVKQLKREGKEDTSEYKELIRKLRKAIKFRRAKRDLPAGVALDPYYHTNVGDLIYQADFELDMIAEGQPGALNDSRDELEAFIEKWAS